MEIFLQTPKVPKFIQEEIDNLKSPVSIKGIEFIGKNVPTKKTTGSMASLVNSIKYLSKKNTNSTQTLLDRRERNISQLILRPALL